MPHQGQGRPNDEINAKTLLRCMDTLLGKADFTQVRFRQDCNWDAHSLASTALLWAWSEARSLDERFHHARSLVAAGCEIDSLGTASQTFMRVLSRKSDSLLSALAKSFRECMQKDFRKRFRVAGFAPIAVDGTRHETPRTEANQKAFALNGAMSGSKSKKSSKSAASKAASPQVNLAVLWHMTIGLPWSWRRDGSGVGERTLLREMIDDLPKDSLIVGDAGFTGYDLWKAIKEAGHDLLVRVGSNVSLLKDLDMKRKSKNRVWLWPESGKGPPLELRLIQVGKGKSTMWLVTTVLDESRLSKAQLVELYRMRWSVEVFYRSSKQTFEKRRLRSKTPEHVYLELDWSLMGLWAVSLMALIDEPKVEMKKVSMAGLLKAVRHAMRDGSGVPARGRELWVLLRKARIDDYERKNKSSRDYPRKKREKPPGDPRIRPATETERRRAREWWNSLELKV